MNNDAKKPVWAIGPALSAATLRCAFTVDAVSDVFVTFMQSFQARAPYGIARFTVDGDDAEPVYVDGASRNVHHLLITRRVATVAPGRRHTLEIAMTNRTQTDGHAFAFYGLFAAPGRPANSKL